MVQLGLKGTWLEALGSGDVVVKIRRLDDLLAQQRAVLESSEPQLLSVPVARPLDCGHLPVKMVTRCIFLDIRRHFNDSKTTDVVSRLYLLHGGNLDDNYR